MSTFVHSGRAFLSRRIGLAPFILMLFGLHPAAAQIEPASVQLVDSVGTTVGPVLDLTLPYGLATVPVSINGHKTVLYFRPDVDLIDPFLDIIRTNEGAEGVFFASTDC